MGLTGFLLLHARSTWTQLEKDADYFFDQTPILDSLHTNDMPCPHTVHGNCHVKLALYATGLVIGGVAIGYLIGTKLGAKKARCNMKIKLDSDKVVDSQDIEEIGEKKAFCRCWKSSKFPQCDGSHNNHNKLTGDNVGPLIISNSKKASS